MTPGRRARPVWNKRNDAFELRTCALQAPRVQAKSRVPNVGKMTENSAIRRTKRRENIKKHG